MCLINLVQYNLLQQFLDHLIHVIKMASILYLLKYCVCIYFFSFSFHVSATYFQRQKYLQFDGDAKSIEDLETMNELQI